MGREFGWLFESELVYQPIRKEEVGSSKLAKLGRCVSFDSKSFDLKKVEVISKLVEVISQFVHVDSVGQVLDTLTSEINSQSLEDTQVGVSFGLKKFGLAKASA